MPKAYAYWITVNYRESYGLHASNGIRSTTSRHVGAKPSAP